jgi:tetratricopeptide (TPR) repeat protein
LELSPDNYDIMIYLSILYKNEGLTAKRAALLERLRNPDEMPQGPVRMVIDIYIDMQEYDKALNLLTSYPFSNWEIEFAGASNLRDMYHRARIGRALKALEAKKWDDAINDLEQSMTYPKNTQLGVVAGQNFISELYLLSICCEKKGDFTQALQYCNKIAALQLSANSPNYNEFIKAIHKKVELEWLGFK